MKFNIPTYLQPMDEYDKEKNKDNLKYAVELCQKHGYLLSLQAHKLLGIR
jgi:organic radical activating enzyme